MRRPPALEWQVPAEPVPLWLGRGLQGLAAAVWVHWALAWAMVQWAVSAPGWSLWVPALLLGLMFVSTRGEPPADTWLRFDGECWHWSGVDDPSTQGSGALQVASRLGPWWLLRARARRGGGRSAWIWLRPDAVRAPVAWQGASVPGLHPLAGTRLRTLLTWS